jgi:hypothetical protein
MWDYDKCIVVDWGEDDDVLVGEIAKKIENAPLTAEYTDDGLRICFQNSKFDLPYSLYSARETARYVTIRKVQELLSGEYHMRVWRESTLSDTHSLYLKSNEWWRQMDSQFPERIDHLFVVIDENSTF